MPVAPIVNFADHILNIRYGQFISTAEDYPTSRVTVDRIFDNVLAQEASSATAADPLRILLYGHGGLVPSSNAISDAELQCKFWVGNSIFPLFFIWHTGFLESLFHNLSAPQSAMFTLGGITNAIIEAIARAVRPDWNHMKENAAAFGGGHNDASYFAKKLAAFVASQPGKVEVHVVGHSAGAILHSYLVPQLLKDGLAKVETAQYLAPAITIEAYRNRIANEPGVLSRIGETRIFAMSNSLELKDTVGPYHGSLLYLIYHALEAIDPTDILGLQISLNAHPGIVPASDCIFSPTAPTAPLDSQCSATSHGYFHTDAETMNSVARRILRALDLDTPYVTTAEALLYAQPSLTMPIRIMPRR